MPVQFNRSMGCSSGNLPQANSWNLVMTQCCHAHTGVSFMIWNPWMMRISLCKMLPDACCHAHVRRNVPAPLASASWVDERHLASNVVEFGRWYDHVRT